MSVRSFKSNLKAKKQYDSTLQNVIKDYLYMIGIEDNNLQQQISVFLTSDKLIKTRKVEDHNDSYTNKIDYLDFMNMFFQIHTDSYSRPTFSEFEMIVDTIIDTNATQIQQLYKLFLTEEEFKILKNYMHNDTKNVFILALLMKLKSAKQLNVLLMQIDSCFIFDFIKCKNMDCNLLQSNCIRMFANDIFADPDKKNMIIDLDQQIFLQCLINIVVSIEEAFNEKAEQPDLSENFLVTKEQVLILNDQVFNFVDNYLIEEELDEKLKGTIHKQLTFMQLAQTGTSDQNEHFHAQFKGNRSKIKQYFDDLFALCEEILYMFTSLVRYIFDFMPSIELSTNKQFPQTIVQILSITGDIDMELLQNAIIKYFE